MSWDVMIFRFVGKPPASTEGMDDAQRLPLGPAADVRASISSKLPQTSWNDPVWGILDGDGFLIEFNVGDDDPIDNIMLHVRGGGDAITAIMSFVVPLGWSASDCSSGEFLDPSAPSEEGWKGFQAYRDKVVGRGDAGEG
jgi:hypothetical protein